MRRPGLFLELSDLGAPVAIVALLAFFVSPGQLQATSSVRAARRAFTLWSETLARTPARTLAVSSLLMGGLWSFASLRRHWAFESHSFDLGIFTSAIWNLVHGFGYVSAPKGGMNLLADHQSPIFWALAPVFRLFESPETLLFAQGLLLAAGAIPLYFIASQTLSRSHWAAPALPLLYWANRPIRNANAFDFHPETLMLPLFLVAIAGVQSRAARARIAGAVALLAALACKESAGPVAAGVGLAWLLGAGPEATRAFTRRLGLAALAAGVAVFALDLKVVPGFFGKAYAYSDAYSHLGASLGQIALSPFTKPEIFWPHLLGPARLKFLFWTLAPLGFLPLLNARALPAFLPGYLMLFLSASDLRVNPIYHYAIEPSVGLFWAMPAALAAAERRPFFQNRKGWIATWLVFWALGAFGRSELYRVRAHAPDPHREFLASRVLPCIDPSVTIAATDALVPHLATRPWAHNLTRLETAAGTPVDCVLHDSALDNWPLGPRETETALGALPERGYRRRIAAGSFTLWERSGLSCLRCNVEPTEGTSH